MGNIKSGYYTNIRVKTLVDEIKKLGYYKTGLKIEDYPVGHLFC